MASKDILFKFAEIFRRKPENKIESGRKEELDGETIGVSTLI